MEDKKMYIGIDVKEPKKKCDDPKCPFHGHLKVRGQAMEGRVVSDKMRSTVVVEREYYRYLKKFERQEKRRSRTKAHNPDCIDAKTGDVVRIMECRPLSKSKNFVVVEKLEV